MVTRWASAQELGVEYDAWFVDIFKLEQFGSEFVGVNPNSKIPALMGGPRSPSRDGWGGFRPSAVECRSDPHPPLLA